MKHNLRLFKIAKLAKDKGFTTHTITTKFTNDYLLGGKNMIINETCILLWMCELQKWLREVYNIILIVAPIHETEEIKSLIKYWYYILDVEDVSDDEVFYSTWEEALEDGLQESLKLIK